MNEFVLLRISVHGVFSWNQKKLCKVFIWSSFFGKTWITQRALVIFEMGHVCFEIWQLRGYFHSGMDTWNMFLQIISGFTTITIVYCFFPSWMVAIWSFSCDFTEKLHSQLLHFWGFFPSLAGREGGVKKLGKSGDVLYRQPQFTLLFSQIEV